MNIRVKVKQNQTNVLSKEFTISLLPNSSVNNTAPISDHNGSVDQNSSQSQIIDQNNTTVENNQTLVQPIAPKNIPIVRTREFTLNDKGFYVFRGRILTNGGTDILESTIEISQTIDFQKSRSLIAELDKNIFQAKTRDLQPGTTYYYRASARNEIGESSGSLRRLITPAISQPSTWWQDLPVNSGGWHSSPGSVSSCPIPTIGYSMLTLVGSMLNPDCIPTYGYGPLNMAGYGLPQASIHIFSKTLPPVGSIF